MSKMYCRTPKEKPGSTSSPSSVSGSSSSFGLRLAGAVDVDPAVGRVDEPAQPCAAVHPQLHLALYRSEVVGAGPDLDYEVGRAGEDGFALFLRGGVVAFLGDPGCVGPADRPGGQAEPAALRGTDASVGHLPDAHKCIEVVFPSVASETCHGQNHQIPGLVHFHFVVVVGLAELDEPSGEIGGAEIKAQSIQAQHDGTGRFCAGFSGRC